MVPPRAEEADLHLNQPTNFMLLRFDVDVPMFSSRSSADSMSAPPRNKVSSAKMSGK